MTRACRSPCSPASSAATRRRCSKGGFAPSGGPPEGCIRSATITPPQAPSGTPSRGVGKPCTACPLVCYFFGLEGVRRPLNLALLAETRARGPDGSRTCACRNWHGARATSSVDGWASMALRSHVVEAADVRTSERRRAWADSSKLASEPDAQSRVREHGTVVDALSPRTHVPLTRRLRRAVAVWPEEPGLTPECTRYILKLRQARTKLAKLEGSDPTPCFSRLKSWDRLPDAQAHSGDGHTQRTSALTRHSAGCSPE